MRVNDNNVFQELQDWLRNLEENVLVLRQRAAEMGTGEIYILLRKFTLKVLFYFYYTISQGAERLTIYT